MFDSKVQLVCIPAGDFVYFGEVRDGKFLRSSFLTWDRASESVGDVLDRGAAEGFKGKQICLAVNEEGLRMAWPRYPEMSAEDLAETMNWDGDRIFGTEAPIRLAYEVLSHTPEGYALRAAACSEDWLAEWAEAARLRHRRIAWAVPVTEGWQEEGTSFVVGLCSHSRALLFHWDGSAWRASRRIRRGQAAGREIEHFLSQCSEEADSFFWMRSADGRGEDLAYWQDLYPAAGGEEAAYLRLAAGLAAHKEAMNLAFEADREEPFFSPVRRELRLLQTCLVLSLVMTAGMGGYFLDARQERLAEEERAASLVPVREEMAASAAAGRQRAAERQEGEALLAGDLQWDRKLVQLADSMPAGVSVRSIESDGAVIRLTGTASSGGAVQELGTRLSGAWQMACLAESVRQDKALPLVHFIMECRAEADHGEK